MHIKSDKGIVGTDMAIAIIIIVLFVTIATTIFYQIGITNIETRRSAIATNGAVTILEKIATMDYDTFTEIDNLNQWYQNEANVALPEGYQVNIQKTNIEKESYLTEVSVSISYLVQGKSKVLTIKTLKQNQ